MYIHNYIYIIYIIVETYHYTIVYSNNTYRIILYHTYIYMYTLCHWELRYALCFIIHRLIMSHRLTLLATSIPCANNTDMVAQQRRNNDREIQVLRTPWRSQLRRFLRHFRRGWIGYSQVGRLMMSQWQLRTEFQSRFCILHILFGGQIRMMWSRSWIAWVYLRILKFLYRVSVKDANKPLKKERMCVYGIGHAHESGKKVEYKDYDKDKKNIKRMNKIEVRKTVYDPAAPGLWPQASATLFPGAFHWNSLARAAQGHSLSIRSCSGPPKSVQGWFELVIRDCFWMCFVCLFCFFRSLDGTRMRDFCFVSPGGNARNRRGKTSRGCGFCRAWGVAACWDSERGGSKQGK